MRRFDLRLTSVCGLLACSMACNGEPNGSPAPIDMTATDANPTTAGTEAGTGTETTTTTTSDPDSGGSSTGLPPGTCDGFACGAHGNCELDQDEQPLCSCDPGYVFGEGGETCVVDESCVQLRLLEDDCRQLTNAEPAVSLFFALDFCAGTAVLPEKLAELGLEFLVLENGEDIENNVESFGTLIPKPVESYVDLVVDVSDSITGNEDLGLLIEELRTLVASLAPGLGEPDVYVSVHVFGRGTAEYVPFTRDFASVDDALAAIALDPASVVELAGGGDGTDLYDAVALGIRRTDRIRDLRAAVTGGGVLTTGTVVVVTDGDDTSNGALDSVAIASTASNVISIGISNDIDAEALQLIGRDGSFVAAASSEWPAAFAEITQRVNEYPLRSYLLGYCSSATEGRGTVEISMTGAAKVASTAACGFDADIFGVGAQWVCNEAFFSDECDDKACAGLTACGACADDACCSGDLCVAPQNVSCDADPEVCGDLVCLGGECSAPPALGDDCSGICEPGVTQCIGGICVESVPVGEPCAGPAECAGLNCQPSNPNNPLDAPTCQNPALLYDVCRSEDPDDEALAVCELGGYCGGTLCLPRLGFGDLCEDSNECRNSDCSTPGVGGEVCSSANACFWSWDVKVPT